jgi:hypothetical protein
MEPRAKVERERVDAADRVLRCLAEQPHYSAKILDLSRPIFLENVFSLGVSHFPGSSGDKSVAP